MIRVALLAAIGVALVSTALSPAQTSEIAPAPLCTHGAVLLCLSNYARQVNGVPPLGGSDRLHSAAVLKAGRQVECNEWSHAPCGDNPFAVFAQAGWTCGTCGENIAIGYTGQRAVMAAWLASPGHRANLLNPAYNRLGNYSGAYLNGSRLWVQDFGARQ